MRKITARFGLLMVSCIILSACGPSQADLDAQATQVVEDYHATQTAAPTATSTPIPTATETPTPIPGKFINPPEFMETVFFSDSPWIITQSGTKRGIIHQTSGRGYIAYASYRDDRVIQICMQIIADVIADDLDQNQLYKDHLDLVLENYVTNWTQSQIYRLIQANTEPGKYQATIDSFGVVYDVLDNGYCLEIWQL